MRTRRGECYPRVKRIRDGEQRCISRKKIKMMESRDLFDELHDDLVTSILCKLSSTSESPADFISVLLTCKRMNELGLNSMVLAKTSLKMLSIRAENWCESAHKFFKRCSNSGNVEACYTLGMIRFYCLQNRGGGASLMAKAAINSHAPALYSLAVIQFNGSGGSKTDKDLRAGVALCARAAFLGHVDALRELGHCLQDGYGVIRNIAEGRRFLVQANARELASANCQAHGTGRLALAGQFCQTNGTSQLAHSGQPCQGWHLVGNGQVGTCPLLSDFGCDVPAPEAHPASQFLGAWFSDRGIGFGIGSGLRMCSHKGCGRPETRRHEFRRCSVCGTVNYCSRACQALDWKMRHKGECVPMEGNVNMDGEANVIGDGEPLVES